MLGTTPGPGCLSPGRKHSGTPSIPAGRSDSRCPREIPRWIDALDPAVDDIELVWEQFQMEFTEQFTDSQQQQRARLDLDNCRMKFPEIDQYIAKFEDLARLAGYTVGNDETIHPLVPSRIRSEPNNHDHASLIEGTSTNRDKQPRHHNITRQTLLGI